MENQKNIMLEHETYVKEGKSYFAYCVKGQIKGKEVKASMIPKDIAGYALLEVIFGDQDKVPLCVTPYEMTTESGEILSGNTFSVKCADDESIEVKLKPINPTDKTVLNYFLK